MERIDKDLKAALLSLGKTFLDARPVYVTPTAHKKLETLAPLTLATRQGTYDLLEDMDLYQLEMDEDGSIPNVFLIPPKSLLICTTDEAPRLQGRLFFCV